MKKCFSSQLAILLVAAWPTTSSAQTIHVDITPSHAVNMIRPTRALGAGIDRLPFGAAEKLFVPDTIEKVLSAGWQTVTYRQNTELHAEAWHWNPQGTWSDPAGKGYFVGNGSPGAETIRHSYGYPLPHRGVTRDDGTDTVGYSRLTDGDENSYWKSNPYLQQKFTGEDDRFHPQWLILDFAGKQDISAMRISWGVPYATKYSVQYWTGEDPIKKPTLGIWQAFPEGGQIDGGGGVAQLQLSATPIPVQYIRILMTASSNTCGDHGESDVRGCVGYAVREIYAGTITADGNFHDVIRHTDDQDQTATYCSSVDPWHSPADLDEKAGDQVGFDLFFSSGITRGLPAMVPIAMLYSTPEDAAAEITYLEKRGYPISYVEMGEEADGHYTTPEDYAALYLQFAAALHKVDPKLKLGGPVFTGVNKDIESWADENGNASWTKRFIDYLKSHRKLKELSFFSYEHYPMEPGKIQWSNLYDEADLVTHINRVWRDDGVPPDVPLFITESNISWQSAEAYVDIWGALWLADYIGAFLSNGGDAVYFFHYLPSELSRGHNGSLGTFDLFSTDKNYRIEQPLSQYFASQLITKEWVQSGDGPHKIFPAICDVRDGAGHALITAYAVQRPDGDLSLMIVNKDQENNYSVRIVFDRSDKAGSGQFTGQVQTRTFGKAQYVWHANLNGGTAQPNAGVIANAIQADALNMFLLPAASITVLRGKMAFTKGGPK